MNKVLLAVFAGMLAVTIAQAGTYQKVVNRLGLANQNDFTSSSASQSYDYRLGEIVTTQDEGTGVNSTAAKQWVYGKFNTAIAANVMCVVNFSSTAGAEVIFSTIPSSSIDYRMGVAPYSAAANSYGFVQIYGDCSIIPSTNTTSGNMVRALQSSTGAGYYVGDSGGVTISSTTFGYWKATSYGGGTAKNAFIMDRRVYGW